MRMFGSYTSTNSSDSHSMSDSDSLSSYSFLGNPKQSMEAKNTKYMGVEDFEIHYNCEEMDTSFRRHISLYGIRDKGDIIL